MSQLLFSLRCLMFELSDLGGIRLEVLSSMSQFLFSLRCLMLELGDLGLMVSLSTLELGDLGLMFILEMLELGDLGGIRLEILSSMSQLLFSLRCLMLELGDLGLMFILEMLELSDLGLELLFGLGRFESSFFNLTREPSN